MTETLLQINPTCIGRIIGFQFGTAARVGSVVLAALLIAFHLWFFRDPQRTPPVDAANLLLAPADGKIVEIVEEHDALYHGTTVRRSRKARQREQDAACPKWTSWFVEAIESQLDPVASTRERSFTQSPYSVFTSASTTASAASASSWTAWLFSCARELGLSIDEAPAARPLRIFEAPDSAMDLGEGGCVGHWQ